MKVGEKNLTTIWLEDDSPFPKIIDQRWLPHEFVVEELQTVESVVTAIADMHVRGAPLIGATAAAGMYLAALAKEDLERAANKLRLSRPTAVNLEWAINRCLQEGSRETDAQLQIKTLRELFLEIRRNEIESCRQIGLHGFDIIEKISRRKNGQAVNILTHCNAGWLACVDYGTATAPIYEAHNRGISVHVWVDETRPRNQGARLTAWELLQHGVPHTVIVDNAGGHLMQNGQVDIAIVGTDRTTRTGDVANKIGTYLKALAAHDCEIPFYVAAPSSSIDWTLQSGADIPIEQRDSTEVKFIQGKYEDQIQQVLLTPEESPAANYAFDVTPARLVTGLITERGICDASESSIIELFPERA